MTEDRLNEIVRKVVAEHRGGSPKSLDKEVDVGSGVISARAASVIPEPFDTGEKADQVYLKDLFTLEESPRLGCGVMEMRESCFDWHLKYDEIDYVIDGCLEIIVDGRKMVGLAGDVLYIPKDTAIKFRVPDYAKFLYVTYPANWEQL